MTDKKTGRSDRRGKTPWYVEEGKRRAVTGREKTLRCDRKELIRRSLDIFSSEKMRDDTMGGQLLRNRGMAFFGDVFLRKRGVTEKEGNTGRR